MKNLALFLCLLISIKNISQNFTFEPLNFQNNYNIPLSFGFTDDGNRLYVSEKFGKIYLSVFNGQDYIPQSTPIIDLSDSVYTSGEQGLLDIKVFGNSIYVYFTAKRSTLIQGTTTNASASISKVVLYEINETTNEIISEQIIIGQSLNDGIPILGSNHVGGSLEIINDESLLISTGTVQSAPYTQQAIIDGILSESYTNGYYKAQQTGACSGKILRVNRFTGDGMPDNPYYDANNPRSCKSRVYIKGLRNPFRFSFNSQLNKLAIADVGESRYESLYTIPLLPLNLGFPFYEGIENYLAPNQINFDNNTSFQNLIIEAQSLNEIGEYTVNKANLAYGRFSNFYTKFLQYNQSLVVVDSPVLATGISIVAGVITNDEYVYFSDFFLPKIYRAKINQNNIVNLEDLGNFQTNITKYQIHPITNEIYYLNTQNGINKIINQTLNIDTFILNDTDKNYDTFFYDMAGKLLEHKPTKTGIYIEIRRLKTNNYIIYRKKLPIQ